MGKVTRIPKRSEVEIKNTWNTADLFETEELWEAALSQAQAEMPKGYAAFKGTLGSSGGRLLEFLRYRDACNLKIHRIEQYASLRSDEDTSNSRCQDMRSRAQSFYIAMDSASSFLTPEIMAIDEKTLQGFYKDTAELSMYCRFISGIRRRKAHILSSEQEKLLAMAGELAASPTQIGSMFRNADIKFKSITAADGTVYPLTDGSLVPLLQNTDVAVRQAAFKEVYNTYGSFKNTMAATLEAQVRQLMFFAQGRNYASTLEASLD
ncbi:MAG: oligoendopeptidase F, partial [Angelakisella sp.]